MSAPMKFDYECGNCGEDQKDCRLSAIHNDFLCEDCFDEDEEGVCFYCGEDLAPEMEDRHPDGIGYYEVVGYKSCPCRTEGGEDTYEDY